MLFHINQQSTRVDFNIHIIDISFTRNEYFLKNSYFTIFPKKKKSNRIKSMHRLKDINELLRLPINETLRLKKTLYQDLPSRYLERYLPKNTRIMIRQVTKINDFETIYRDLGYFELKLHEILSNYESNIKETTQEELDNIIYEYPIVDPEDGAEATIRFSIQIRLKTEKNDPLNPMISSTVVSRIRSFIKPKKSMEFVDRHQVNDELFTILKRRSQSDYSILSPKSSLYSIDHILSDDNFDFNRIDDNHYDEQIVDSSVIDIRQTMGIFCDSREFDGSRKNSRCSVDFQDINRNSPQLSPEATKSEVDSTLQTPSYEYPREYSPNTGMTNASVQSKGFSYCQVFDADQLDQYLFSENTELEEQVKQLPRTRSKFEELPCISEESGGAHTKLELIPMKEILRSKSGGGGDYRAYDLYLASSRSSLDPATSNEDEDTDEISFGISYKDLDDAAIASRD